MRRIALSIILLMFVAGSLFAAGCGPKDDSTGDEAFQKIEEPAEDNGGE